MKYLSLIASLSIPAFSTLSATPITVSFEATVNDVYDADAVLGGKIEAGTVITGKYTYDPQQPDSNPEAGVGDYNYFAAHYGTTINLSNTIVGTKPRSWFLMETVDGFNGTDYFLFHSYENTCSNKKLEIDHIYWQLDDYTGTALSSDMLPAGPPEIEKFQSSDLSISGNGFQLSATVTKVALGNALFRPVANGAK